MHCQLRTVSSFDLNVLRRPGRLAALQEEQPQFAVPVIQPAREFAANYAVPRLRVDHPDKASVLVGRENDADALLKRLIVRISRRLD